MVVHADQVPLWPRLPGQRQLCGSFELEKRKKHGLQWPSGTEQGGQVSRCEEDDGASQMRQTARAEGSRFRVTLEVAQVVRNVWKPHEAPTVSHCKPILVVPGAHGRLSNIGEDGCFLNDEIFEVGGKQKVLGKL